MVPLSFFQQAQPLKLKGTVLHKGGAAILVRDELVSDLSLNYFVHLFVGVMPARRGLDEMFVVGVAEQAKSEDFIRAENVRFARFLSRRGLAAHLNQVRDVIEEYGGVFIL